MAPSLLFSISFTSNVVYFIMPNPSDKSAQIDLSDQSGDGKRVTNGFKGTLAATN